MAFVGASPASKSTARVMMMMIMVVMMMMMVALPLNMWLVSWPGGMCEAIE